MLFYPFFCAEPLIGKAYVKQIIDKLHATLSEAKGMSDAGNMEPLVTFISDVAATFFSSVKGCLLLASAEELLMTVFQLRAQDQISTHLSGTDSKPARRLNICLCRMWFSIYFNITPQIMSSQLCVLLLNACLFFSRQMLFSWSCSTPTLLAFNHWSLTWVQGSQRVPSSTTLHSGLKVSCSPCR